jgi:acyl-homoserine lactone synthase
MISLGLAAQGESQMIVTLYGNERTTKPDYFDQFYQLRHQIFVAGRGWPLPSKQGRETDEYDVDDAVYFFDVNGDDRIEGAVRITPTETGSLTADYFPHLVENGEALRSPQVYEATRYIVLPVEKTAERNRIVRARILAALTEWCLDHNVTFIQAVIDSTSLATFVELNPQVRPMGLTHSYGGGRSAPGGGDCLAIRWPCTQSVIEAITRYGGLDRFGRHAVHPDTHPAETPVMTH